MNIYIYFIGNFAEPKEDPGVGHAPSRPPRTLRRGHVKVEYEDNEGTCVKKERWEPPDWWRQLSFIREMRSGRDAPVDQMGAEKCYDSHAPPEVTTNRSASYRSIS